ncbi:hypothetical protein QYE76_045786 [Lolium multiflorum]|uniref:Arabidopsis retrotransposon Orf1 C-terminal domain-containing protein n=1 Tax=Lolium multiflorum TaxID=4521 RepID=A0AAD8TNN8_LOLMU|nr:hypothetical protein QYE76_045786 [Lolium multiflorum]
MGKPRDTKITILPSTTRKGTTLSTSAALDSPSVISKLVSPPQASNAGTSAESENSSYNCDDASDVLDNDGSLGSFLDATIAKSRQIENTETPNENAATPVNSPESVEYSSDDLDEDYVELDDDFIEKCNATTDARKIKKLLAEHAVRYKLSPDPKFATSPINIRDKDYDFSLDLSHIAIVEKTPFCGTEKESAVEHMIEKRTPDDAEELLAKISRNHDDWSTPEPTPTPIVKKRGMIKLNDEDMREAKKSLKEKGIKPEDVKNLPPIEDLCEITPPSSMIEEPVEEEIDEPESSLDEKEEEIDEPESSLDEKEEESDEQKEEEWISYPCQPSNESNSSSLTLFDCPPCLPKKVECYVPVDSLEIFPISKTCENNYAAVIYDNPCYFDKSYDNALFVPDVEMHGILDDFFTLVNRAGLATYVGDEREQYYMLTKIFVESFKFHNTQYEPTVAFKIYDNPVTMELEEFCRALDIAPVGTARRIDDNPRDLLELYRGITEDDCRTIQRGKIRNIQLPAIKYFAYYIATSILGRENTSNISSYHLAFLNAALTGQTLYHLGSLIARRLSSRGPIFGGTIALRILTHLRLPLDSNDVPLTPRRLDIAAMKSHHFVTTDSTIDNMVYRMLFADGNEKEIPLPQPGLFNIDRQSWSLTKEEVEEHMKIQDFHQQHDSEDAEPSYDCTVTYPDVSSSTYLEPGRSSSYYGDTTSWGPWE